MPLVTGVSPVVQAAVRVTVLDGVVKSEHVTRIQENVSVPLVSRERDVTAANLASGDSLLMAADLANLVALPADPAILTPANVSAL